MSLTQWILSIVLLAWALLRNIGTREVTRMTFALPIVIVVAAAAFFLLPLPTAGNDLTLIATLAAVGTLFGIGASAVTRMQPREGRLIVTAGFGFAALWVMMIGARVAFAEWASGPGARAIGLFSRDHAITGPDAWTAGLVVMALAMVLARTLLLALRAQRLKSQPVLVTV